MRQRRGGVDERGLSPGKGTVWFDPLDPDRSVEVMWGSYNNNGLMTGMSRNVSSIERPSHTVFSGLRAGRWARAVGVTVPDPLPIQNPDHPFWTSEFFDICIDVWSEDLNNEADPYHFSKERAAPPCSHFPNDPHCGDWNGLLDGEWNENLHGFPREPRGNTRYGRQQIFLFADGSVRSMSFTATYRAPDDNMWSIRK